MSERFPALMRALAGDMAVDAAIHREWMISMGRRDAYAQSPTFFASCCCGSDP
jgi:hypothetical protein